MPEKLTINDFKWVENISKFDERFIKSYKDVRDFLEVDNQYLENLHNLYNDSHFFPEKLIIKLIEKLVAKLDYKTKYEIHIKNLKQALKPYIDMNIG